jgi:pimeloyl-ACP methyl ester carboxylesterase
MKDYPDVLLVRGLTYSSMQFDLNIREYSLARILANQGFRVWLLDITGYGQSQKPTDGFLVNSDYAAEDINAAADYIMQFSHTKKINVLGWSWGTITTSRFAAAHPDKINKLILLEPILYSVNSPVPTSSYQPFSLDEARSDFDPNKTEPDVLNLYLEQTQKYDGAGSPNGGRMDLSQPKTVEMIPYRLLKVPTLFVAGTADPHLSAERDLSIMMDTSPYGSCSYIVQGGGHALFLENAYRQVFQSALIRYLTKGCYF